MALSANYINALLEKFMSSKAGSHAVKIFVKNASPEAVCDKRAVQRMTGQMLGILEKWILSVIPSFDTDAIHAQLLENDGDGNMIVKISIDSDALWRDSLASSGTDTSGWKYVNTRNGKLGTDNIILQFAKGWDTNGKTVSGFWHGRFIESKDRRLPNDFLTNAVNEFNQLCPTGVSAELETKYKT